MPLLSNRSNIQFENLSECIEMSFLTNLQLAELKKVLGLSDFIGDSFLKETSLLPEIIKSGSLLNPDRKNLIEHELQKALTSVETDDQLHRVLRKFRRKHMVMIAWRELLSHSDLNESLAHLSFLADQIIFQTMNWLYDSLSKIQGIPMSTKGVKQSLFVFAMGKLGGGELNFSSDIDLIFAYPERGVTQGGRRSFDNQKFFIKLGQSLIAALHQITSDGFVYRVDMRLRPFGDSGPLVISFDSVEDYYQTHGREWERYAMVKARVIGEEGKYKRELEKLLKPFVYRRYIDFSAIDSLRKMKEMINAEVRRKGLKDNIKLGMGGIREIEFVAQAFQLIRGGIIPKLQCKNLLETLKVLGEIEALPIERINRLTESYLFLRSVENILQQIADKQTQTLPVNELDRQRLISVLGFLTWDDFYSKLNTVMKNVHSEFQWVIGDDRDEIETTDSVFIDLVLLDLSISEITNILKEQNINEEDGLVFARELIEFKEENKKRSIGIRGQETLDKLLPLILQLTCTYDNCGTLLGRVNLILLKIMRRTAYLELLNENISALKQLLKLCSASPRVATQIADFPMLLDELLDPKRLYNPTKPKDYKPKLAQFMLRIPEEDLEQLMEGLRQFKQMQFLRIAAADIVGAIELTEVSDHLTYLSEALMNHVIQIAWKQLIDRFGYPSNVINTDRKGFAVIGYGKMGGFELGYSSDLDIVFLHDDDIAGVTSGPKLVSNQVFYSKLAQKIIHLFSARTNSGVLYEIDLRLRPSGESGALVCAVDTYQKYLDKNAWTWEHQALVRSRCVYSDEILLKEFNFVRREILSQYRDQTKLQTDIVSMRSKMRKHLNRAQEGQFDLKQSIGGMVDIEFIAQYLVLSNGAKYPDSICKWSDNLQIFRECCKHSLLTEAQTHSLIGAYCALRNMAHRLSLNKKTRILEEPFLKKERKEITDIWDHLLETRKHIEL